MLLETAFPTTQTSTDHELWHDLMQFYIREAWMLDQRRYKEWLTLLEEDLFYFMPRRLNVSRRDLDMELTQPGDLAFFEETKKDMEIRVARLDTGMAWSEDPPSRTRHLIGNLVVEPLESGEVKALTAFLVYRSHLETDQDLYSGYREDILRRTDQGWKIAKRTIVLDANVILTKNISIFF
ncbi:MAG: 3-phenylpropionate/cinnamic acid dioxygenase subunit beta [Dehalococcoidia bacterium]